MSPSVTVRLLATQSDARLVELAGRGHERAFEALVQRYRRPLLGYCRRVLLPEARAEDALQQALLQAWIALQRGDDVRDARAWLYRIVHNTALNALRGSGYDYAELSEAISGAGAPQEDLDRRIAVREALAGLAALPEQQREALLRTAVEGASHAAAAAEMGLSEGALRGLVYRARATLRTAVTAITPMPLVSWAADAAGHGAAADLAVGGGSAGLAGLLAKGGAAAISAGVLAAGVGAVAEHHGRAHAASHPVHAVRVAAREAGGAAHAGSLLAVSGPSASAQPDALTPHRDGHSHRHGHGHRAATAPISSQAPAAPVHPRAGERADGGGGTPPRQGTSEGDDGHERLGGGTGPGGRQGRGRLPGSGTAPAPGTGDDGSGDDGHGGGSGGGSDDGGSGGTGSSGSGDTGSQGDSGGGGSRDSGGSSGGDGASSGSDSSGGSASGSGGSGD